MSHFFQRQFNGNNISQAERSCCVSDADYGCDEEAACAASQAVLQDM